MLWESAGRLGVWLAVAAVGVELCVSANLLTWAGVPYTREGGSLLIKLHPATVMLLVAAILMVLGGGRRSDPVGETLPAGFLVGMALSLAYLLIMTGTGNLIVLLDTFVPAGILAMLLCRATQQQLYFLRRLIQVLIAINALLALGEVTARSTLVPLYLNDAQYRPHSIEFRPTALFDHPLTGSVMTMLGLALCPMGGVIRVAFGMLMWAALIAFGGRTALAVSLLAVIVLGGLRVWRMILQRDPRLPYLLLTTVLSCVAAVPLVGLAIDMGVGTRLAGHLYWDESAQVRLAQWQLLDQLDSWQLLFGTRRDELLAVLNLLRLDSGVEVVENFWLLMFVSFGAVGFPLFALSLAALLVWCWRQSALRGRLLLVSILVVASASNSLGRKSTILVCLVATIACLRLPRAGDARTGRERGAWTALPRRYLAAA